MSELTCRRCGGTGDKWSGILEDWTSPREDCPHCNGTGVNDLAALLTGNRDHTHQEDHE